MAPRYGIWRPLPEHASQQRIRPTQMIAHSIVGSARSAYNYFLNGTSIESHWIMTKAGEVWQLMESDRRADANYMANRWANGTGALSMETEDNSNPDRDPWTHAQVRGLIDWFRWGHQTFGIPLELPVRPADPGIGYHTLHPNHWTNVRGKTCPGRVRIEQFYDLILPALSRPKPTPQENDEMVDDIIGLHTAYFGVTPGTTKWDRKVVQSVDWHLAHYIAGRPLGEIRKDFAKTVGLTA